MASIFDSCDLPQVVPIPDAGWTDDVSVPEAPQTIGECGPGSGPESVPLPAPEQPCPTLTVGTVETRYSPTGRPRFDMTAERAAEGCCETVIDVDAELPCVQFVPETVTAQVEIVETGQEYARLRIEPVSPGSCAFLVTFEVGMAGGCPDPDTVCAFLPETVTAETNLVAAGDEAAVLTVAEQPFCTFDFALRVDFPVGCPTFGATDVDVSVATGAPTASLSIVDGGGCAFDASLTLGLTCVSFGDPAVAAIPLVPAGSEYVTLTFLPGGDCSFDLALTAGYPCAGLTIGPQLYEIVPVGQERSVVAVASSAPCGHAVSADVGFPCSSLVLGPLTIQQVACNDVLSAFWDTQQLGPCTTQLGLVVRMPQCGSGIDPTPVEGGPTFSVWTAAELTRTDCELCLDGTRLTYEIAVNRDGLFLGVEVAAEETVSTCVDLLDCSCNDGTAICADCCNAGAVPGEYLLTPMDDGFPVGDPAEPFDKWSESGPPVNTIACTDYNNLNVSVVLTKTDGPCNISGASTCCWVSEPILVCNTGRIYTGNYPDFAEIDCPPPCPSYLARWELTVGFDFGAHLVLVLYLSSDTGMTTPIAACGWESYCCIPPFTPGDCVGFGYSVPPFEYDTSIVNAGQFWHPYEVNYLARVNTRWQGTWGAPSVVELQPLWPAGFDYDAFVAECPPA